MITVIGSLNYDLVTFTDKVPEGGETFQANSFENHLGGKGLNEALACARLSKNGGQGVRMIGNVGADSFGKELKQALVDAQVDVSFMKTLENQSSGVAVILVEKSGENRILITAGANGELKPTEEEFEKYFPEKGSNDYVVLQNEFPYTLESITWLKKNRPGINIAYNPSPFNKSMITPETLSKLDFLILNEGEAVDVAQCVLDTQEIGQFKGAIKSTKVEGFTQLATKIQGLIDQNNVSGVVITMGSEGSVFVSKKESSQFVPSRKVEKVIDTTGAGDTFFGGVVSNLSSGSTLLQAVEFATAASSLAIQKKGAAEGIPFYKEVSEIL